jgi:hypothetical protein
MSSPKRTRSPSAGKKRNAGFTSSPEEWEARGHQIKQTDPTRSARYYKIAQMVRDQIAIQAGRTH